MAKTKKREDQRYEKKITVGRNPDGSLRRISVYGTTKKELERKVAEIQTDLERGIFLSTETVTFGAVAENWITFFKPLISEKMRLRYKGIIDGHLKPLLEMKVKDLRPMHLQRIINEMAKAGYAQKSMQMVKQTASQVLDHAMQNDLVYRNVFEKLKVPHVESIPREPITEEQRDLILRTWKGHRMGVPALIMLYCGLRRGELLALLWSDIDLDNRTLSVTKAADMPTNATTIKKPKTRAGIRTVPIPNAILPALQWAKNETKSLYVCPNMTTGGIMSAQAYGQAWRSYMHYLNIQAGGKDRSRINPKIVAMEPFTAHQLRHSYATMLYDADVDVKTAQKLLGHADFGVTMKIYTHLSAEKETAGIEKLNEHLDQLLGRTIEDKVKER
ncbi:MAG: site-specific integrase [Clostridia bacterium]|nr:site-specific integrase [Clostridia bacterium]